MVENFDKKCECEKGWGECFFGKEKSIMKNYFSPQAIRAFLLNEYSSNKHKLLIEILNEVLIISVSQLVEEQLKLDKTLNKFKITKKPLAKTIQNHLSTAGLLSRKESNSNSDSSIGKIIQLLGSSNNQDLIQWEKKFTIEISKDDKLYERIKTYNFHRLEKCLYKDFAEILLREFRYNTEDLDDEISSKIQIFTPSTQKGKGRWSNPDVIAEVSVCGTVEYYTYEIKRWLDMSPVAPHEARNHARIISNYPYVAIHAPKALFEFIVEYNYDFQIIKEDCRERGVGLILFDAQDKHFFKILNASYFKPDIFRKKDYIKDNKDFKGHIKIQREKNEQ